MKHGIIPDREQAIKNYSDSIGKVNQINNRSIFCYYKTSQLFELPNGVSLNKDLKR